MRVISCSLKVVMSMVSENVRNSWLLLKSKSKDTRYGSVVSGVNSLTINGDAILIIVTLLAFVSSIPPCSMVRYVLLAEIARLYSRRISSESVLLNVILIYVESSDVEFPPVNVYTLYSSDEFAKSNMVIDNSEIVLASTVSEKVRNKVSESMSRSKEISSGCITSSVKLLACKANVVGR